MNINEAIGKYGLPVLGLALTFGSTIVNNKNNDKKMEETIAKRVKEALETKTKES